MKPSQASCLIVSVSTKQSKNTFYIATTLYPLKYFLFWLQKVEIKFKIMESLQIWSEKLALNKANSPLLLELLWWKFQLLAFVLKYMMLIHPIVPFHPICSVFIIMLQILQFHQKQDLTSIYYCIKHVHKRHLLLVNQNIA